MDQDTFKSDIFVKLGQCWSLESLDVTGAKHIDDQAFVNVSKAEVVPAPGEKPVSPGLVNLKVVKVGFCSLSDFGVVTMCKVAPNIEHLEINRLETLTEYSVKFIFKELTQLKFLDANGVSAITYQMLDELKTTKPNLIMRKFRYDTFDKKDNGLRVPRRVVEKKKKKKKGKKSKK